MTDGWPNVRAKHRLIATAQDAMISPIAIITARGGSKGIPGKNIKTLGGKPLIAWTIEAAIKSRRLKRVIVSTDGKDIARVCRQYGAEVPFLRPPELARDDSSHLEVMEHAIRWLTEHEGVQPEYVLLLQPTSPFRTEMDINAALDLATKRQADAVISVSPVASHPYWTKRIMDDGTLADFVPLPLRSLRRQDLPPAYVLNGAIYLIRTASLLRDRKLVPKNAVAYIMPPERSLDVDTPWDWHVAELLMQEGKRASRD